MIFFWNMLLGNWYTQPIIPPQSAPDESVDSNTESASSQLQSDTTTTSTASQDNGQYCYCGGPEEGLMIACDNTQCKIEWFHKSCLQIKNTKRQMVLPRLLCIATISKEKEKKY